MQTFLFTVDYAEPLESMLARTNYIERDPRIRGFSDRTCGRCMRFEATIFSWGNEIVTFNTSRLMHFIYTHASYRPWISAGRRHLVSFMASPPSLDRAATLFALGSGRAPFWYVHWRAHPTRPSFALEEGNDEWWVASNHFLAVRPATD